MSCSASTTKSNRDPRHGAQRGVLNTVLDLVADGSTHIGIATDHVIESWRNDLYEGYKDGAGIDPELFAQFPEVEELLTLAGFEVWPQIEHEADDAMAAAAAQAAADERVEQVVICTPDKDLAQCVTADGRVIQFDRRREIVYDRDGVIAKFGVPPESIPDYLGVVGDTADGFPGLPGWGAKSAAAILTRYSHIDHVPHDVAEWDVNVRGAAKLAQTLHEQLDDALLFRRIATVDLGAPVSSVDAMAWRARSPVSMSAAKHSVPTVTGLGPTSSGRTMDKNAALAIAAEAGDDIASRLEFLYELDQLKTVLRQSMLADGSRQENSAEHSWHLAMTAMTLAPLADEPIDVERAIKILLVHDIVEIDAGDVFIYDDAQRAAAEAAEQEAADRIFGLLPAEQGAEFGHSGTNTRTDRPRRPVRLCV